MIEIVFVHLGDAKAQHLWRNIKSLRSQFPEIRIHVIYSDHIQLKKIIRVGGIPFYYQTSNSDEEILLSIERDGKFRRGFWRYSFERLLALENWHSKATRDTAILHLESDILLMPNFPFGKIFQLKKLAWTKFNESHDVSAILFSPNVDATSWLANALRAEIRMNPQLTDMTALSAIAAKNIDLVEYLPTVSTKKNATFDGVFDGASIGMWLNGRDPRNSFGLVQRNLPLPEAYDDASLLQFRINAERELIAQGEDFESSIFNLHIHSKKLGLFGSFKYFNLRLDILRSKGILPSHTFSLKALKFVLEDHIYRHGLKMFLRNVITRKSYK